MQPVVYFPLEIKVRELPSRLWMANDLLARGFTVVIGNQWSINANQAALPPGVFVFKTVNKIQGHAMAGAKAAGHMVVANDEEVLNFMERGGYLFAFSDVSAQYCDLFLAQSEAHARTIEDRFPPLRGKILVVGNPRTSLMHPRVRDQFRGDNDPRIAPLKPYILVNTNYGSINSIWDDDQTFFEVTKRTGAFDGSDEQQKIKEFWDVIAWERENHQAMRALLTWMAPRIKGVSLVIRPHPVERAGYWEQVVAAAPNALVVRKSDPYPWISEAELVIHTGCTTGLEAAMLGRRTLNLLPSDHPLYDGLVNYVNPRFRTWEDAAEALKLFLTQQSGPLATQGESLLDPLKTHLPTYFDGNAAGAMVAAITDVLATSGAHPAPGAAGSLKMRQPYSPVTVPDLAKEKFEATAEDIFNGLDLVSRATGVEPAYRLETLDDGVFVLSPA